MKKTFVKKKSWLFLIPFLWVLIALLLCLTLVYSGGAPYTRKLIVGSLVFAAFPAAVISLSGYFGMKILLFLSSSGLFFAFGAMFAELSRVTGWQDLSSIMMFIVVQVFFIIAGAAIELVVYVFSKFKRTAK